MNCLTRRSCRMCPDTGRIWIAPMVACCRPSSYVGTVPVEGPASESVCLNHQSRVCGNSGVCGDAGSPSCEHHLVRMGDHVVSRGSAARRASSSSVHRTRACCQAQRVSLCSPATVAPAPVVKAYGTSSCAWQQHADCSVGSCAVASEFNALSWFGTYRVTCTTTREEIHCARLGRLRGAVPSSRFQWEREVQHCDRFCAGELCAQDRRCAREQYPFRLPSSPCPRSAFELYAAPAPAVDTAPAVAHCAAPALVIGYVAPIALAPAVLIALTLSHGYTAPAHVALQTSPVAVATAASASLWRPTVRSLLRNRLVENISFFCGYIHSVLIPEMSPMVCAKLHQNIEFLKQLVIKFQLKADNTKPARDMLKKFATSCA